MSGESRGAGTTAPPVAVHRCRAILAKAVNTAGAGGTAGLQLTLFTELGEATGPQDDTL